MIKKVLAIIIYCFLFLILLFILSPIFVPKWRDGDNNYIGSSVRGFYNEKKNSLDVLFMGNSDMYRGIIPIELWDKYGIASYAYTSPSQLMWTGYYILQETLMYQHPKIIVYNIDHIGSDKYDLYQNYRKAFDNMKWSKNKFKAIMLDDVYEFDLWEKLSYIFPILYYHNRWNKLSGEDFKYAYSDEHCSHKGYDLIAKIKPYNNGDLYMENRDETFEMEDRVKKYLDKFVDKCKKENIELILVEVPSADSWDLAKSKTMTEYAKTKGIKFIDLNLHLDEMKFDWKKDTPDGGDHLNIYGAEKVTKYIGEYLSSNYKLPDRRKNKDYSIWYKDSRIFHKDVENAKKEVQNN